MTLENNDMKKMNHPLGMKNFEGAKEEAPAPVPPKD